MRFQQMLNFGSMAFRKRLSLAWVVLRGGRTVVDAEYRPLRGRHVELA